MPRGKQILSTQQRSLLESARAAHARYDQAEREARAEYEALVERRLRPLAVATARAVRAAVDQGVPKSRVNLEVLGTTTPMAYVKWTEMAEKFDADPTLVPATIEQEEATLPPYYNERPEPVNVDDYWPLPASLGAHEHAAHLMFVGNPLDRRLSVTWDGYESTAPDAPDMLMGEVRYDPDSPTGWVSTMDPQNKETPFGVETGALTFEVEIRRGVSPLREALEDFVKAAQLPPFEKPTAAAEPEDDGF